MGWKEVLLPLTGTHPLAAFPRPPLLRQADPYCQLWLRENRKLRTATAKRTLTPTWNEKWVGPG